mgnify:CR=1 FL=1
MSNAYSLSPEQTLALVQVIADTSETINQLHFSAPTDDPEVAYAVLATTRDAVLKIGWIADMLARSMGGHQVVGDAKSWFLPTAFLRSTMPGMEEVDEATCHE